MRLPYRQVAVSLKHPFRIPAKVTILLQIEERIVSRECCVTKGRLEKRKTAREEREGRRRKKG